VKNLSISQKKQNNLSLLSKRLLKISKTELNVILEFEEKLRKGVEGPLTKFLNSVSGINNGISAFWDSYKRRL
jgi:hypothetical protein